MISGVEVLRPGSDAYEAVRRPAMARFADVRPAEIARCASTADVVAALERARGRPLAVRSGGHCFAGRSSTEGVLIDVGPIDGVEAGDGTVRVGAGARLRRIYDVLDARGEAIAGGCGPDVGIAGLLLGGGLGVLGRMHGLTCDQLIEAEVVLADGHIVRAGEASAPDLFWALRGAGGGQFGVVTEFVLRTVPGPRSTVFRLRWPLARAAELLDAWQRWSPGAPDAMAASLLCTRSRVTVFGSHAGPRADAEALLAALPEPSEATLEEHGWRDTKRWLADNGPGEGHEGGIELARSVFVREPLPAAAVAALAAHHGAGAAEGLACELDLSPWAGAYTRVAADATAFAHRDARFLAKLGVSVAPGSDDDAAAHAWLDGAFDLLAPHGTGGSYPNFPDPALEDPLRAYHGDNLDRLREVKRRYDPERVFSFPQSL
jgi:FAD/FMN-containing dehydrogenase